MSGRVSKGSPRLSREDGRGDAGESGGGRSPDDVACSQAARLASHDFNHCQSCMHATRNSSSRE